VGRASILVDRLPLRPDFTHQEHANKGVLLRELSAQRQSIYQDRG